MSVSAIIVNYYTGKFLIPLLKVLNRDSIISEIIVVNNSPSDGLDDHLASFNKTKQIVNIKNEGFAKAVNIGTAIAKGDWLLLINPDTKPDKNCIKKLLKGAIESDALIAGPRFFWDDKKKFKLPPALGYSWSIHTAMQSSTRFALDAKLFSFYWQIRHEKFWSETQPFFEPFLSGACLLIRNDKNHFRNGKIFDERYFLYFEDTDLCANALLDEDVMVCIPDAHVVHYWNQSPTNNKSQLMVEMMHLFLNKYYSQSVSAIPKGTYEPEDCENLGCLNEPPHFLIHSTSFFKNLLLEIALNPFFVPFMQADFNQNPLSIPRKSWELLGPGTYFARLRKSHSNKVIRKWSWKKL